MRLFGDDAARPSLQVRALQACLQNTMMCIFSFEDSSFATGGAAAAPGFLRADIVAGGQAWC